MKRTMCWVLLVLLAVPGLLMADDDTLRDLGTNAAPGEIPKWDGAHWRNAHDNITTVTAGAGLTGTMTSGEIALGIAFGGQRTNDLVAAYTDMDATRPPIGAIVAWAKNLTGVNTNLPLGWVECNGQTLSDTNSTLSGAIIPDLNGQSGSSSRFLRGSMTSGNTGGASNHTHNIASSMNAAYILPSALGSGIGAIRANVTWDNREIGTTTVGSMPPYYEVVWIMRIK